MGRLLCIFSLVWLVGYVPVAAATLDDVQSSGVLHCGVDQVFPGFSVVQKDSRWHGFSADVCRAVAGAVIGNTDKVIFTILQKGEEVEALQSGEIDLLVSALPYDARVEREQGLLFAGPLYFSAADSFGPWVRQGDDQWLLVVQQVRRALINGNVGDGKDVLSQNLASQVLPKLGDYSALYQRGFGLKPDGQNRRVEDGGWLHAGH